jgi:predicted N-acetyltransferase YhbS
MWGFEALIFRKATDSDLPFIFENGFDAWNSGLSLPDYIETCTASPKYKKGQWWVLENADGIIVSSLITYPMQIHPALKCIGIGSVATKPIHRGQGIAAHLMRSVISEFESHERPQVFLLYSDLGPKYYEQFGFSALSSQFQTKPGSVCMVRCSADFPSSVLDSPDLALPAYF